MLSFITCLHEHLGKNQFHDQYHVDNQDHTSTEELEQECQGHYLKRQVHVGIPYFQNGQIYINTLKRDAHSNMKINKYIGVGGRLELAIPFVPLGK